MGSEESWAGLKYCILEWNNGGRVLNQGLVKRLKCILHVFSSGLGVTECSMNRIEHRGACKRVRMYVHIRFLLAGL